MTRTMLRPVLAALAATMIAVLALGLAACGSTRPAAEDSPAAGSGAADPGAFPVTVRHKLGSTTIKAQPQRVVTTGLRDQDFALALGVQPVGVAEWFKGYPYGRGQWATEAAGSSKPKVVASTPEGPDYEAIASLRPDLILNVYAKTDQKVYDKLSAIAPTVNAPSGDADYTLSWQSQLKQTGLALGRADRASRVTTDLDARIARTKASHPEFLNKSIVYGGLYADSGAYTSADQRGRFLTSLGFRIPKAIDDLATDQRAFFASISTEKFALFDTDVAIITGSTTDPKQAVKDQPIYARLKNVQDGRAVFLNELQGAWSGALSFNSPLSLPYVLDTFIPALAAAADNDPSTKPATEPRIAE